MTEHFISKCIKCGTVISQCRCAAKDKNVYETDTCDKCTSEEIKSVEVDSLGYLDSTAALAMQGESEIEECDCDCHNLNQEGYGSDRSKNHCGLCSPPDKGEGWEDRLEWELKAFLEDADDWVVVDFVKKLLKSEREKERKLCISQLMALKSPATEMVLLAKVINHLRKN